MDSAGAAWPFGSEYVDQLKAFGFDFVGQFPKKNTHMVVDVSLGLDNGYTRW